MIPGTYCYRERQSSFAAGFQSQGNDPETFWSHTLISEFEDVSQPLMTAYVLADGVAKVGFMATTLGVGGARTKAFVTPLLK